LSGSIRAQRYPRIDAWTGHITCPPASPARLYEFPIMPLDSNSRLIAGLCGAALVLLATWFHGNGKGLERGTERCSPGVEPPRQASDCDTCHLGDAGSLATGRMPPPPTRMAAAAPRS
jgi:hypothetical protein